MWAYRSGQLLLVLAALSAVAAFVGAVLALTMVPDDRLWIECWRTFAFLVFAGLFALLAWRPTQSPLVWELGFLHKAAMVSTHLIVGDVPEARSAALVDLVLSLPCADRRVAVDARLAELGHCENRGLTEGGSAALAARPIRSPAISSRQRALRRRRAACSAG